MRYLSIHCYHSPVKCFAWSLPDNHPVYMEHNKSLNNITVSNIISLLNNYKLCAGVKMFPSGIMLFKRFMMLMKLLNLPFNKKYFIAQVTVIYYYSVMIYAVIVMHFKITKIKTKVRKVM